MPGSSAVRNAIYERPVELLQSLIRFDTTNPPGNEAACIAFIDNLLTEAGIETKLFYKDPARPNLIARLKGQGRAPALMLYGHVDVVPTAGQKWTYPPFEGKVADGFVWGRGALDMKGGLAMMLVAVLRAKAEGLTPAGDVVLAVLSDEEAGGDFGAGFLVERHAEEFRDIRYAIGEFGGFPLYIGRKKFYTIQIAEKQICWMRATVRGPSGHASQPMRGGASAKLGRLLVQLDESILPPHITPVARMMIEKMASALPFHAGFVLRQVLKPSVMKYVLRWLGERGKLFEPLLRNTVNATTVRGGEKTNVIPGEIVVELDGRLLPGYGPQDMIQELRRIVDKDVEIEIVRCDVGTGKPEMGMFRMLADILVEGDSDCVPLPLLLTGSSDARFFKRLGIQTYGFLPMNLPESFNFVQFIHGADERIPVEALTFGARAMYKVLERYSFSVDL